MSAKARITSDFPTPSDVAAHLRIKPLRAAELRRQLLDFHQPNAVAAEVKRRRSSKTREHPATSARAKKK